MAGPKSLTEAAMRAKREAHIVRRCMPIPLPASMSAELAALAELPAPTLTQREEIIDGERVMLPALPPDLVPWRAPDDPACVYDESGRACEGRALGRPAAAGKCVGRPTISRSNGVIGMSPVSPLWTSATWFRE